MTLPVISKPILVISYNADTLKTLSDDLQRSGVTGVPCESFLEAEDIAREGLYNGILVDLQSIVKAKGDEKVVACSLTGFYPTLRVRALGAMLVPMAMPGDARQDSSLKDFLAKSCAPFMPRRLRLHRRRDIVLSAVRCSLAPGDRLLTLNISWGGAFLVDVNPEKYEIGQDLQLEFPEFKHLFSASVCWTRTWGERRIPGVGIAFREVDEGMESILAALMQHDMNDDRDRMIAR
jgi:hypothetical protein